MRELNSVELQNISGGCDNNGYNFSFAAKSGAQGAFFGFLIGLGFSLGNFDTAFDVAYIGALFGAGYGTVMMVANALDCYAFSEAAATIVPSQDPATITP